MRGGIAIGIALVAGAAALLYAPLFGGFWLGDDGTNLHSVYALTRQHRLLADTAQLFVSPAPSGGAFYRPLMMASIALNYVVAGTHYGGWFAVNLAVHLANIVLVAACVLRLAKRLRCDGRGAAVVAALLFGLAPVPSEAVYWVSARSDGWIVLLSLLALLAWSSDRSSALRTAIALPLLLVVALGFKESAAVLPLQMALVAWAWPTEKTRAQIAALGATFVVVAAWFALRASLFGTLWHVYAAPVGDASGPLWLLSEGVRSIPGWWASQAAPHERFAFAYLVALAVGTLLALSACRGAHARLAVALAGAAIGLQFATLLNVGLHQSGEGGRHFYAPGAWFALAAGVALARPQQAEHEPARHAAVGCLLAAALVGSLLVHFKVGQVLSAQQHVRAFAASLEPWAAAHPGLTMIIAAEMEGAVVTLRNAQGAIALPPIQSRPLLHRTLPTLPRELTLRHDQFANGLTTRLEANPPAYLDAAVLAGLAQRDTPRWPSVACWSTEEGRLIALPESDPANAHAWTESLLASARRCWRATLP